MIGIDRAIRFLVARKKATFILYHDPDPSSFQKHLTYLTSRYTVISLERYLQYRQTGMGSLPPYPLVITFDDGHRRNFDLLELIQHFEVDVTFYVCSAIVCTRRKYWFKLSGIDSGKLKKMNHETRMQTLVNLRGFGLTDEMDDLDSDALCTEEFNKMNTFVNFQSHTRFHPILTTCTEEVVLEELRDSRIELEQLTGKLVTHFAYPNGDYSPREIRILRMSGYQSARTTDVGWNDDKSDPFRLKITGVTDNAPLWMLKAELSGVPGYLYNLYKSGLSWKSLRGRHTPERNLR